MRIISYVLEYRLGIVSASRKKLNLFSTLDEIAYDVELWWDVTISFIVYNLEIKFHCYLHWSLNNFLMINILKYSPPFVWGVYSNINTLFTVCYTSLSKNTKCLSFFSFPRLSSPSSNVNEIPRPAASNSQILLHLASTTYKRFLLEMAKYTEWPTHLRGWHHFICLCHRLSSCYFVNLF